MVNSITKCFIGLILLFGLGCNQSAKQSVTIKKTDTITTKKATGTTTYVTWDSVKLNGTIPMLYNSKEAEEKLGKADSIITPDYENVSSSFFNNKSFKYCYFRGITFEKSGDTLAFMSIDFTKASTAYLGNDHIRLNGATSLIDFKNIFPNVADNSLIVQGLGKTKAVTLAVSKKETEDKWLFIFNEDGNKLLRIDYWIPD